MGRAVTRKHGSRAVTRKPGSRAVTRKPGSRTVTRKPGSRAVTRKPGSRAVTRKPGSRAVTRKHAASAADRSHHAEQPAPRARARIAATANLRRPSGTGAAACAEHARAHTRQPHAATAGVRGAGAARVCRGPCPPGPCSGQTSLTLVRPD